MRFFPEKHDPGLAAVLSFIFNGLGQLYNGQILKGLIIIFISAVLILFLILGSVLIGVWMLGKAAFTWQFTLGLILFLGSLVFICFLGIYSIINAYKVALKK